MTDGDSENLSTMSLISEWIKDYCGLNVVNSDDLCLPGQLLLSTLHKTCEESFVVFLVQRSEEIDRSTDVLIQSILLDESFSSELVILKDKSIRLPKLWAKLPTIDLLDEREITDISISMWLSNIFGCLLTK